VLVVNLWTKRGKLIHQFSFRPKRLLSYQIQMLFHPWWVFNRGHWVEITEETTMKQMRFSSGSVGGSNPQPAVCALRAER